MQRFWSWLAVELGKRAGLVALVGLILTLVLGFGITRLEFATGQDSYLNKDDEVYIENVAYQDLFGGQAMLGLITMDDGHTIDELFDADGITQFRSLHDDLMADDAYVSVITPLTVLEYTDTLVQGDTPGGDPTRGIAGTITLRALAEAEPGSDEATARQEDSVRTLERAGEIPPDERTIDNPDWIDFLLFDNTGAIRRSQLTFLNDPSHASIVVRLPGNLSIDDEGVLAVAAMERMNELSFPNATVTATGAPILLDDINHYLRGGMLMLGGIAVAIMTLILLVLFDVRWRLLPLAVILVGVVWAFGLAGYLGIPLTIVTIAGLPVMLGVGIDYAIQLHARVEEEVILDRSDHPMQETARNLGPALLVVTFDAIFAFLALRFAQVPMLRDFGLLLAVGIAVICLNSIVMPLAALGIREYRSPTTGRDFRQGALGRLTVWLGSLPQVWAIPLAVASVAIFIGGIAVEDDLQLQTDPIEWVDQSSQTVQDIHTIEDEVGTSGELGVFVETDDLYTNENLQWMHDFRIEQFDKFGPQSGAPRQLLTANSIEQVLSDITYLDGFGSIAPTGAEAELGWAVAPADIQASLVIPDGTAGNIVFRVSPGSIEDLAVIVNDVRDNIAPPEGTRGHSVGTGRRRRRSAREPRSEPRPAHVPGDAVRVPVPRGATSFGHPRAAVARSRGDCRRCGVAGCVDRRVQPQPDDGRRRTTRHRHLHRVHLVDPVALRRGTRPRHRTAGSGRRRRRAHRPGLHRLRPDGHCRGCGVVVLDAAVAARLRTSRRHERHRRVAQRPRRAASAARVGGAPWLGVPRPDQGARSVHRDALRARRPGRRHRPGTWQLTVCV